MTTSLLLSHKEPRPKTFYFIESFMIFKREITSKAIFNKSIFFINDSIWVNEKHSVEI